MTEEQVSYHKPLDGANVSDVFTAIFVDFIQILILFINC